MLFSSMAFFKQIEEGCILLIKSEKSSCLALNSLKFHVLCYSLNSVFRVCSSSFIVTFFYTFVLVSPFFYFIYLLLHSFFSKLLFLPYLLFEGYFVTFSLLFNLLLVYLCFQWEVTFLKLLTSGYEHLLCQWILFFLRLCTQLLFPFSAFMFNWSKAWQKQCLIVKNDFDTE